MIYTPMTNRAMQIAYAAHHGQVDKSGVPYILHPVHLAEQMTDEHTTCVALLHDTVEDTYVTMDMLAQEFPSEVTDAVALLTHNDGSDYLEYVQRIKANPIAKAVKLADLRHNTDISRLHSAGMDSKLRKQQLYQQAIAILEEE